MNKQTKSIIKQVGEFIRDLPYLIIDLLVFTFIGRILAAGLVAYLFAASNTKTWERHFDDVGFRTIFIIIFLFISAALYELNRKCK